LTNSDGVATAILEALHALPKRMSASNSPHPPIAHAMGPSLSRKRERGKEVATPRPLAGEGGAREAGG
jgi:hypothetical protein